MWTFYGLGAGFVFRFTVVHWAALPGPLVDYFERVGTPYGCGSHCKHKSYSF